jgi:general secretion pathway protein C
VVWLLVAASAVHWALRLGVRGSAVPSQAQSVGLAQALQGDPQRLFARSPAVAAAAPSPARDRFRVLGVAAQEGDGWVLMAVDGKPVRAYRRGSAVDGQWQVLAVAQRRVDIGPAGGPAVLSLDLPALPAAATGRLGDGVATVPAVSVPPGQLAVNPSPVAQVPPGMPGMPAQANEPMPEPITVR